MELLVMMGCGLIGVVTTKLIDYVYSRIEPKFNYNSFDIKSKEIGDLCDDPIYTFEEYVVMKENGDTAVITDSEITRYTLLGDK